MSDLYDKEVYTLLKMGGQKALENQYKNISRRLDNISEENRKLKKRIAESEDKISEQKNEISMIKALIDNYRDAESKLFDENQELKQRISELENENKNLNIRIFQNEAYGDKKLQKINLNDRVKVKLTPLGAEIYYHQYDNVNKRIKENGGTELEPIMPQIDKDGYTEFQLWHFMELYGDHIGMCKPNVINPLDIIIAE